MGTLPDRPLLVPLQPHISQEIFHRRFLKPMDRHETVGCLIGLMEEIGWVPRQNLDGLDTDIEEKVSIPESGRLKRGITMISHSKWVTSNITGELLLMTPSM